MLTLESYFAKLENISVIDLNIPNVKYCPIDLSVNNPEINKINVGNPVDFEFFVDNHLSKNKSDVAFGGYNEVRNLYSKKSLFNDDKNNQRNIHIGIDLWTKAGTSVLAALDGIVFGFKNNVGNGNYGPTIILEHHLEKHVFYTLYGHLSLESIEKIKIGMFFSKQQQIATLGDSCINGGYAPHLHFQIIKKIDKNLSDYPGVCSLQTLSFYLENCPNPNLLLKL
jgi:murein DD-endopeptidase MepM/ murein hydrolase activator NlpD